MRGFLEAVVQIRCASEPSGRRVGGVNACTYRCREVNRCPMPVSPVVNGVDLRPSP